MRLEISDNGTYMSEFILGYKRVLDDIKPDLAKCVIISVKQDNNSLIMDIPVASPKRRIRIGELIVSVSDKRGKELIVVSNMRGRCVGIFNLSRYLRLLDFDVDYFIEKLDDYILDLISEVDLLSVSDQLNTSITKALMVPAQSVSKTKKASVWRSLESNLMKYMSSLVIKEPEEKKVLKSFGKYYPEFTYVMLMLSDCIQDYSISPFFENSVVWLDRLYQMSLAKGVELTYLTLFSSENKSLLINLIKYLELDKFTKGITNERLIKEVRVAITHTSYYNNILKPNKYLETEFRLDMIGSALKTISNIK